METAEKIVEAYFRFVRECATIPNIKCAGQFEIDLLAINLKTLQRYHVETSVSGSKSYSKLTANTFDREQYKQRVGKAKMRRTLGFFVDQKFNPANIGADLARYGFSPENHTKVIVTWDATPEAEAEAKDLNIELLSFQQLLTEIEEKMRDTRSYYVDDTLRTINLFIHKKD